MPTPHYGQPRYRTIADELRTRIQSGVIPPGSLLPAESALTVEFQTSRGTIRKAIAALRDEGLLLTEHGRGTYVDPSRCNDDAIKVETYRRPVAADPELAALFAIAAGEMLLEQQAITRRDGTAETVVRTYSLPKEV
ncbi:GntR family transcriptional regulator [Micromonospora rifamycinica]|uniref:GntR family transcriptional regulator n=1 Tax=Micromonospora rifamycinica TaxID=291594 RepID=UPI00342BAF6A